MKKLLFILMAVLSLCACSSNDDDSRSANVTNQFVYDGKSYPIDKALIHSRGVTLYSGDKYTLEVYNCDFETGKKNYLSAFEYAEAGIFIYLENGSQDYEYIWGFKDINESSYVTIKNNDEDNRTYIKVYINDGEKSIKATYLGVARKE